MRAGVTPPIPSGAPGFYGFSSSSDGNTTFTPLTLPAAAAVGKGSLIAVATGTGSAITGAVTTPSGYTAVPPTTPDGTRFGRISLFYKTALAAPDLAGFNLTESGGNSARWAALWTIWDPFVLDVTPTKDETNTSGTSATAPSITPVTAGTTLVTVFGHTQSVANSSGVSWGTPTGMTYRANATGISGSLRNMTLGMFSEFLTGLAPSGSRVSSPSAAAIRSGVSLILRAP